MPRSRSATRTDDCKGCHATTARVVDDPCSG
jgi:hypothetical protein